MKSLVIEYIFDGPQRGYNFTTPTHGYSEDITRAIWRQAMPRGQGWAQYIGARALKCFALPDKRVAVCSITVTDNADESGRKGIRRAEIDVYSAEGFRAFLQRRLLDYSASLIADADAEIHHWQRTHTLQRIKAGGTLERFALTYPYRSHTDWHFVEALILRLAINPPPALRAWGFPLAFTTLALSHHDEGRLVAIPTEKLNVTGSKDTLPIKIR